MKIGLVPVIKKQWELQLSSGAAAPFLHFAETQDSRRPAVPKRFT